MQQRSEPVPASPAARTPRGRLRRLASLLPVGVPGRLRPATRGALKRFLYEEPGRDRWQKPQQVVTALGLARGDRVADLGAGGGCFTFRFAAAVGPEGRVYAVDVDADLLAYVAKQAQARELPWIRTLRAADDAPGLAPASVDLIFASNVFHHLPDPARTFADLRGALRPDGRVAVVEARGGRFFTAHSTPAERIAEALARAGYARVEAFDFLPRQSFQTFQLRGD